MEQRVDDKPGSPFACSTRKSAKSVGVPKHCRYDSAWRVRLKLDIESIQRLYRVNIPPADRAIIKAGTNADATTVGNSSRPSMSCSSISSLCRRGRWYAPKTTG